jgi:hypothetical protein
MRWFPLVALTAARPSSTEVGHQITTSVGSAQQSVLGAKRSADLLHLREERRNAGGGRRRRPDDITVSDNPGCQWCASGSSKLGF